MDAVTLDSPMWKPHGKDPIAVRDMPNGHIHNCLKNLKDYGMKDPTTFERSHELAKKWIKIFEDETSPIFHRLIYRHTAAYALEHFSEPDFAFKQFCL